MFVVCIRGPAKLRPYMVQSSQNIDLYTGEPFYRVSFESLVLSHHCGIDSNCRHSAVAQYRRQIRQQQNGMAGVRANASSTVNDFEISQECD